jgi:hypothetical protein
LSFGSTRYSSRRSASLNIFSPDLPPGLPEMPFLNAIDSTPYYVEEKKYFAAIAVPDPDDDSRSIRADLPQKV